VSVVVRVATFPPFVKVTTGAPARPVNASLAETVITTGVT
jgi:hypothetical protein